jgi:hypothetical protein
LLIFAFIAFMYFRQRKTKDPLRYGEPHTVDTGGAR